MSLFEKFFLSKSKFPLNSSSNIFNFNFSTTISILGTRPCKFIANYVITRCTEIICTSFARFVRQYKLCQLAIPAIVRICSAQAIISLLYWCNLTKTLLLLSQSGHSGTQWHWQTTKGKLPSQLQRAGQHNLVSRSP